MSAWIYDGKPFTDPTPETVGFVYLIENLSTGKKYIGKKNFFSHKYSVRTIVVQSGALKGTKKKKKTKIIIPSDWETYFGSNDELKAEVEKLGSDNYRRTILRLCKSKAEMSYYEAKEQFEFDVLLSDDFYNAWICVRCTKRHLSKVKEG